MNTNEAIRHTLSLPPDEVAAIMDKSNWIVQYHVHVLHSLAATTTDPYGSGLRHRGDPIMILDAKKQMDYYRDREEYIYGIYSELFRGLTEMGND